jgi:hypothetical protein
VCWNITRVSLWLLCNVHFMQSKQRTSIQKRPFVRGINNLLKIVVCASRNQVVAEDNGFRPVCCIVRRNQRELQLRTYQYQKQQCGGFWLSVWCLKHTASKWYNNCRMKITGALSPLTLRPVIFLGGDMSKTGYSSHHCHVTSLT